MNDSLRRIYKMHLKADGPYVRGATDNYHVTTISPGMNDSDEYASLFAAAPKLLQTLSALADKMVELRERSAFAEGQDAKRIDQLLDDANAAIAAVKLVAN